MSAAAWLDDLLDEPVTPAENPEKWEQNPTGNKKWERLEALPDKAFSVSVPTVPTVPTFFTPTPKNEKTGVSHDNGGCESPAEAPEKIAPERGQPLPPIPPNLLVLVDRVSRAEGWPQDLQAEHIAIIARQLVSGAMSAESIAKGWQAHLARWHNTSEAIAERAAIMEYEGGLSRQQAERLAATENDCGSCQHWQGVLPYHEQRNAARTAAGLSDKPRSAIMGSCAKRHRPWRVSNVAGSAAYGRWHFLGRCSHEAKP